MLVSDLIAYSLRVAGVLGVGQVALAQDTADAQTALFLMLSQWQRRRWLVPRLIDLGCPVVPGQSDYTIGPTPPTDFSVATPRPGSIEAAYLRQLFTSGNLPVDYPLSRIDSMEEFSRISLKALRSWPTSFYYDPAITNGTVFIWPVPIQNFFELHIVVAEDIIVAVLPNTDFDEIFGGEYQEALVYNLAARFRIMYALPASPDLNAMARSTLQTLRSNNFRIQQLRVPAALRRGGRIKNPSAGFVETAASIPFSVLP